MKKSTDNMNNNNKEHYRPHPGVAFVPVYNNPIKGQRWNTRRPNKELDYIVNTKGKDLPRIRFTCDFCGCEYAVLQRKCRINYIEDILGETPVVTIDEFVYDCPNCGVRNVSPYHPAE
jgi:hypothetical protein